MPVIFDIDSAFAALFFAFAVFFVALAGFLYYDRSQDSQDADRRYSHVEDLVIIDKMLAVGQPGPAKS